MFPDRSPVASRRSAGEPGPCGGPRSPDASLPAGESEWCAHYSIFGMGTLERRWFRERPLLGRLNPPRGIKHIEKGHRPASMALRRTRFCPIGLMPAGMRRTVFYRLLRANMTMAEANMPAPPHPMVAISAALPVAGRASTTGSFSGAGASSRAASVSSV